MKQGRQSHRKPQDANSLFRNSIIAGCNSAILDEDKRFANRHILVDSD